MPNLPEMSQKHRLDTINPMVAMVGWFSRCITTTVYGRADVREANIIDVQEGVTGC
jgi:hypothetical protein